MVNPGPSSRPETKRKRRKPEHRSKANEIDKLSTATLSNIPFLSGPNRRRRWELSSHREKKKSSALFPPNMKQTKKER